MFFVILGSSNSPVDVYISSLIGFEWSVMFKGATNSYATFPFSPWTHCAPKSITYSSTNVNNLSILFCNCEYLIATVVKARLTKFYCIYPSTDSILGFQNNKIFKTILDQFRRSRDTRRSSTNDHYTRRFSIFRNRAWDEAKQKDQVIEHLRRWNELCTHKLLSIDRLDI